MFKVVISVVLTVFACGAGGYWLYQDVQDKQQQEMAAIATQQAAMQGAAQARAEAKRRTDAKASFEFQINANLASCLAAADNAFNDYAALIQKAAPSKRGVSVVPIKVTDGAAAVRTAAKAECQNTHDTRLHSGQ